MELAAGTFLKATAQLRGDYFENALIYVTECNVDGALGYVINRRFPRSFNELVEFIDSPPIQLYEGGPVEQEKLFFIHRRPDLVENSQLIANGMYTGGDFKQAVALMNDGALTEEDFKLFIGYCGWDTGELVAEIQEGSWVVLGEQRIF